MKELEKGCACQIAKDNGGMMHCMFCFDKEARKRYNRQYSGYIQVAKTDAIWKRYGFVKIADMPENVQKQIADEPVLAVPGLFDLETGQVTIGRGGRTYERDWLKLDGLKIYSKWDVDQELLSARED